MPLKQNVCSGCGQVIHPAENAVHFQCPGCKEIVTIWRCERCRKFAHFWRCVKCNAQGP